MRSQKLSLLVKLSVLTLPFILTGCLATTVSVGTDATFCGAARAIYWSSKDTAGTIVQIKEHNAVGRTLCKWGAR